VKRLFFSTFLILLLILPCTARAIIVDLSDNQIKEAENFGILHKEKTGVLLNNHYSVGKADVFSEHAIVRSKWHKLSLMTAFKGEHLSEKQRADILNDPCLQIDIIMFGHSIRFASDYQAKIINHGKEILPEKIHADHFQVEKHKKNRFAGFPAYRATIRTYFSYDLIDPACSLTLIIKKNGSQKKIRVNLENYK